MKKAGSSLIVRCFTLSLFVALAFKENSYQSLSSFVLLNSAINKLIKMEMIPDYLV